MKLSETIRKPQAIDTIWLQIFLWVSIYFIYSFILSFSVSYPKSLAINLVNVPLFMSAYYLLKYVQLPLLYNKGKTLYFILSLAGSAILLFLLDIIAHAFLKDVLHKEHLLKMFTWSSFLIIIIRLYSPGLAVLTWEVYHQRNKERERIDLLEKERIATELKFLRAQINPHFLFNTLNNLYSFVVTDSPKAPEMIKRLSGILDYILNKSHNSEVQLQDEVSIIRDFIGLEEIRYGERLQVKYKTEGNLEIPIAPMILLSIVENAYKHGASGDIENPSIKIKIKADNKVINCEVWNTKSQISGEINDAYKEGIGLSNIKRQLNLSYPGQHELVIDNQDNYFNLNLIINNNS